MKYFAIIVAGGKGLRMGKNLPKQFIPVKGTPVLMHTIRKFHSAVPDISIIIVLPKDHQQYWKDLCSEYNFDIPHTIADGGETRYHSVKNGLFHTNTSDAVIAIHDGVRPFVSEEVICNSFNIAEKQGTAVPVIELVDSIRHKEGDGTTQSVSRDEYVLVQTPQVFRADIIHAAYAQSFSPLFTDDASVAEANNITITTIPGNRENVKITTPFDLKIAEIL
ncbi:MAG: 2-C-methyl-D-erythritol 4-phosphate cytidylyltransferase [Bacteroidales bacterium]